MPNVIYRHWAPGDDEGVMRILGPMGWCSPERYATKFEDAGLAPRDVLIAERDGQIIGHLMLPHRTMLAGETRLPTGGIGMVVVDPNARGLGIGRALLRQALAHHRAAGNLLVALFTHVTLVPAYPLYLRYNFVPVAQRVTVALQGPLLQQRPLRSRPASADDGDVLEALANAWAHEHAGVATPAYARPRANLQVFLDGADHVVACGEVGDRDGQRLVNGLVYGPTTRLGEMLAAAAAGAVGSPLRLTTTAGNRVHQDLQALCASHGAPLVEDYDDTRLLVTCIDPPGLLRRLADSVGRPAEATAGDGDGRRLVATLFGQTTTGDTPTTWPSLVPRRRPEMRLIDCW